MKKAKNTPAEQVSISELLKSILPEVDQEELDNIITNQTRRLRLKPKEKFCDQGEKANELAILVDGAMKSVFTDENGKEHVTRFFYVPVNIVIVCLESLRNDSITSEAIVAVTDCTIFVISNKDLNNLFRKYPQLNIIARHLAESSYCEALKRIRSLQVLKAEPRLRKFNSEHRRLFQIFSKLDIASYLGMHRNQFNRLFKKL